MKRIRLWEGVGETGGEEGLGDGRRDAKEKEVEREREKGEGQRDETGRFPSQNIPSLVND